MAEKRTEIAPREQRGISRRDPFFATSPFRVLDRFAEEMDRVFSDFGFGRGWISPRFGALRSAGRSAGTDMQTWAPDVDVFQRDNELVARADLPGLTKDDVKVEVTDDAVIIQGERKREHEEEREGVYRAERSYGVFYRVIPLPEGAMADQAKATFKDGVLEVTMPAPPEQVTRGRKLEITEGSQSQTESARSKTDPASAKK
jgi:HSP20 family protein